MEQKTITYNRARHWQLVCQPMSNLASNLFLMLFNFATYLAVGGYGIVVGVASIIITGSRLFDAVTDPIIGFIIDRTNGKFGKFRPMMVLGYGIMTIAVILMYFVCVGSGTITFILLYALYIIGYTFATACTKATTAIVTNDPAQRPIIGRYTGIYSVLMGVAFSMYVSNYLAIKHQGINIPAMQELALTTIIISGVLTGLSMASIWKKDTPEFTASLEGEQIRIRDIWPVIKGNRALQMLIVAASSDKLALQAAGNTGITMLVFGVIIRNYAFQGQLSLITAIPTILLLIFGMQFARRFSSKSAVLWTSVGAIVSSVLLFLVFVIFDPTQISAAILPTALFLVFYCLRTGFMNIASGLTNPMIADIADYELYRTGKFMPGMMGTIFSFVDKIIFSFVDKIISSFAATISGFMLASIGYVTVMPQADDAMLSCLAGAFPQAGVFGRVQHGSAWWFNDTRLGMERQLTTLASLGALGGFVGMLTDSRSFLSYTRHEYFRRILCGLLGRWVENGEYPNDEPMLARLVRGICHDNAQEFFNW